MYIPTAFRKDDIKTLYTFMQENSFATLVTCQDGIPFALLTLITELQVPMRLRNPV